ncbi:hypothetical protein GE061_015524 [Apolygus lucorum]|uniref:Solute carrier family 25 member 35 n=1 Tax=Apolygus lucorum TaxID=248454 RepID=A0A6A4JQ80_APOLU|nr:hypothetical protein GE061_015524 [Apolygus lucorum]
MEFVIGAASAVGAGCFTNPMEVVKTRMQLQGELTKRGHYVVHYRNFFHAFYVIAKNEGIFAIQKGLAPALCHQVVLNGVRLGGYQYAEDRGLNLNKNGEVSIWRSTAVGAVMGVIGVLSGSPLYMVKTRLQSQAGEAIAVGTQHKLEGTISALVSTYRESGLKGLWRGAGGSVPRMMVGSSTQLTSFYVVKEFLADNKFYVIAPGLLNTFVASMIGGVAVAITMGPLDLISTRLYNQGFDKNGRGLLYTSYMDCVRKMWRTEGFAGFYKGIVPCYMRIGPHTVLCFVFWDQLKQLQKKYTSDEILETS